MKIERFQNEEEWLSYRVGKITGTTAAACLGLGKWKSEFSLWMELTQRTKLDFKVTEPMKWGKILEGPILENYKSELDYKPEIISEGGFWAVVDESRPWLMASPDLIHEGQEGRVVVDAKNTREFPYNDDDMPIQYTIQLLTIMSICNCDRGVLAVLHNGQTYKEYTLDRNEKLIQNFLTKLDTWYDDHIVNDIQPEADGTDATKEALARATWYNEKLHSLSEEAEELIAERETLKEEEKELKDRLQEIENTIKAEVKGSKVSQGQVFQVTCSKTKASSYVVNKKEGLRHNFKRLK